MSRRSSINATKAIYYLVQGSTCVKISNGHKEFPFAKVSLTFKAGDFRSNADFHYCTVQAFTLKVLVVCIVLLKICLL